MTSFEKESKRMDDLLESLDHITARRIKENQKVVDRFKMIVNENSNWSAALAIKEMGSKVILAVAVITGCEEIRDALTSSDDANVIIDLLKRKATTMRGLLLQPYQFTTADNPINQAKKEVQLILVKMLNEYLH